MAQGYLHVLKDSLMQSAKPSEIDPNIGWED